MEELWKEDFNNSIKYFSIAYSLYAQKEIRKYLETIPLNFPISNWIYMFANGKIYKNPLWEITKE